LKMVPLADAMWPRTVGITSRRNGYLSPLAHRFIELLRQHGKAGMHVPQERPDMPPAQN
jgi:DNA-binding transcriptional LysR family regulator